MNMDKEIKILNLDDILPNRFQPRIQFNDKNINELAESIKEHGVIQPIVVRRISDKYEIIAGERRYKASVLAGKTTIPAIITDLDDKNSAEIALIENVQRQDLTPIEEAVSYKKILDMGYLNQTELAEKLGKTQSTIANKLRLLNLNDEVQEALLDGKISERHARSLLKLNDKDQINMLSRIINERLTVRKTDEEVDKMLNESNSNDSGEQKIITNESVGTKMNDEIKNEFNIPDNPIYQEEVPTIEPISSTPVNPGFMDVQKIEKNAEDIFKEEKPADVDALLEAKEPVAPAPSAMAPIPEEDPVQQQHVEQPRGKFFNMFNFALKDENPNFVENVENQETNMDFGIPKREEKPFNPFLNDDVEVLNPFNSNTNNNTYSEETNTLDSKIDDTQSSEKFTTFSSTNSNIDDNVNNTQISNPFENSEKLSEEAVHNLTELPSVEPETYNYNNEKVTEEKPEEQEELFTSVNPYHLNDDSEFTTKIPVESIQNELKKEPVIQTNEEEISSEPSKKDFRSIINMIRECKTSVENSGYEVELEELDFEDKYQVVFNIKK